MSESMHLAGKVWRRHVPRFELPVPHDAPALRRILLPQGELAQFHDGDEAMRYIAAVELQPATIRGNHYHDKKREWMYLLKGEMTLRIKDLETGQTEDVSLATGDLVYIPPRVGHAFRVNAPGYGVEFSPVPFDPADTFKCPLF